jgi:hypothetical protein
MVKNGTVHVNWQAVGEYCAVLMTTLLMLLVGWWGWLILRELVRVALGLGGER